MADKSAYDPAVLAVFDTMVAGVAGVERKGATMPYVSINGNMYAMINKLGVIGLRLAAKDLATFNSTYGPSPYEGVPGFVSKEYVTIRDAMQADPKTLQVWFRLSHGFASRLPPKPTR